MTRPHPNDGQEIIGLVVSIKISSLEANHSCGETRIRICFIVNHPRYAAGGAEAQAIRVAELLARRGIEVYLITQSRDGEPRTSVENGVHIEALGLGEIVGKGRRQVVYLIYLAKVYKKMKELDADIYYHRNASLAGAIALFCRLLRRPFIFGSSSIWNVTVNLQGRLYDASPFDSLRISSPVYKYGIGRAAAVVAQTEQIASIFKDKFPSCDVRHVPPLPPVYSEAEPVSRSPFVLSITRLIWYRSPDQFLSLARMLPETQFVLGGYGPMQDAIEQQASAIPNLRFLGGVTSQESQALMRQSAVYVNTSRVEGFPNTLLECASAGTPYVGFYDPDEAICGYGLGVHASTLEDMASSVRFLLSDENARNRISSRGKEYLVKHHDARVIGRLYEDLFTEKAVRRS